MFILKQIKLKWKTIEDRKTDFETCDELYVST